MCVAAIAWNAHPDWLLVCLGNRDEYHERPSAPLSQWDNGILAGHDLRAGGTWLGVTGSGRFALVTNYRVPDYPKPGLASRGALVTDWLEGRPMSSAAMNPYNLLTADARQARLVSNYPQWSDQALPPGVHGLSNGEFQHPWAKTRHLCSDLSGWLSQGSGDCAALLSALRNAAPFPPDQGMEGPQPANSGIFVDNPVYGTRCSTVVAITTQGAGTIIERRFSAEGETTGEDVKRFDWEL